MMNRRRPLLIVAVVFALGIWTASALELNNLQTQLWQWNLGFVLLGAILFFYFCRQWRWFHQAAIVVVLVVVFALGLTRYTQDRLPIEVYHQKAEFAQTISGVIENYPTASATRTRFLLKPDYDVGLIQVFYTHPADAVVELRYGDRVEIVDGVQPPRPFNGFDYPAYLAARDVWAVAFVDADELDVIGSTHKNDLMAWGESLRHRFFAVIDDAVAAPHNNTLKALMFGERSLLDDELEDHFRDAGVAHVLAVSGLHLGILLGLFWFVFRRLGLSVTWTYLIIGAFVLVYLLLVGWKVSLVRAALLFVFLALGHVFKEWRLLTSVRIDSLQGWALAAIVVLGVQPQALFDVGFQLSFSATGTILLAVPLLPTLHRTLRLFPKSKTISQRLRVSTLRWAVDLIVISLAAQLGVWPLVAFHFQQLYVGTLLSNIIVVPWMMLILWASALLLLLAFISTFAQGVGIVLSSLLHTLSETVAWLSALPGMSITVTPPPVWGILTYYVVLASLMLLAQKRWRQPSWSRAVEKASATS